MNSTRHLLIAIFLSTVIIFGGTVGYMLIENWNFLDALYMTVITISTVGFREVHQVNDSMGRWYTIFLVMFGVGFTLYVTSAVVQFMVEGRIRVIMGRRRLDRQIDRLKQHYIVCGYGRIGRVLCRDLQQAPTDLIVLESNPALVPKMEQDGMLYIRGDATDEDILIKAGIRKAKGLVAVLATDTDNVFLVLTARQLAPELKIIARAGQDGSKKKLLAAGANYVESPYELGAVSMARRIVRPTVTNFLDLALKRERQDILMEEIPVSKYSLLVNVPLKDSGIRQKYNLIIIAIKKPDGSMQFNPSFESRLTAGDTVVAVGDPGNLKEMAKLLTPEGAGI
jgi:voltage-gated potassium channel